MRWRSCERRFLRSFSSTSSSRTLTAGRFCRKVRLESRTREVPIVFLTALADVTSRVRGLAAGGDDYIVKPFSRRELVARVRAVLRRAGRSAPQSRIAAGNILIDRDRHEVTVGGRPVLLTLIEFSLLACLAESPAASSAATN